MATEPAGLSRDLPAGRVMRADVGGEDVVLWRSASGVLSAWANRCPHRGMRLSHGFVRGETLACLYHGWHYGRDAACRYIPAHPDLEPPATIMATRFGVAEQDGIIWVAIDGAPAPGEMPSGLGPLRSMRFACPVDTLPDVLGTTSTPDLAPIGSTVSARTLVVDFLDRTRLAAVLQTTRSGETTAHFLVSENLTPKALKNLSRWCEAARRRAETGVMEQESHVA